MAGLEGRTVLLTGASGAIGAETARRLAGEGARLAISGRRSERLPELGDEVARGGGAGGGRASGGALRGPRRSRAGRGAREPRGGRAGRDRRADQQRRNEH